MAAVHRFNDERHCFLALHEVHEIVRFVGEDPSLWEEVELTGHGLLHELEVLGQIVFQTDDGHPREVVHLLIGLQAAQLVDVEVGIDPRDVPVRVDMHECSRPRLLIWLPSRAPPTELLLCYVLNEIVPRFPRVEDDLLRKFCLKFFLCLLWLLVSIFGVCDGGRLVPLL